jgi:hypothetical protein
MGVIMQRDDGHMTMVKGNDDNSWSSDGVVLWLGRRKNRDTIECWAERPRLRWSFYSSGGWESGSPGRVACCGDVDSMLRFQDERRSDGMKCCRKTKWGRSELVWAQWEGSVIRCNGVATSARGEAAPERGKRGDDASWADMNLTAPKNKENPRGRFNY